MTLADVLAQGVAEYVVAPATCVGITGFFMKWLMSKSDKDGQNYRSDLAERNKVIEELARESMQVSRESVKVMQQMSDRMKNVERAIQAAPCRLGIKGQE